ncbi:Glucose 1-dehydrogenase 2 [Geodia barretti]|uniref:Glucose 1-dehydrogenase 2 n=1 Tax=Geodia barretti TaxID=519541 RepID=A0AA35WT35_GEOBA|nr:Glucose 1-dehydrogenase 2 [Geodia barretti]
MGIRVNAIAPGMIDSPGQHSTNTEEEISERVKAIPLQRIGQPRDVGDAVAFLASDAAGYISGITLPVTGGR